MPYIWGAFPFSLKDMAKEPKQDQSAPGMKWTQSFLISFLTSKNDKNEKRNRQFRTTRIRNSAWSMGEVQRIDEKMAPQWDRTVDIVDQFLGRVVTGLVDDTK